ncbi:zinc finger protein 521-like [Culicoides brevitarsis]|uniref:zinc finger protein 521-like n=1 Tax=Culicoides brevitarsis TaxID=469753 RepID=UPI00307BBC39
MDEVICRFCLCKIEENPKFLQKNEDFSQKVEEIFFQIGFTVPEDEAVPICSYCYDYISKFAIYYEFVKQNLLKFVDTSTKTTKIDGNEAGYERIAEETVTSIVCEHCNVFPNKNERVFKYHVNRCALQKLRSTAAITETPKVEEKEVFLEEYKIQEPVQNPISDEESDTCEHKNDFPNKRVFKAHIKKCLKKSFRRIPSINELKTACPLCPTMLLNEKVLKLHLAQHHRYEAYSKNRVLDNKPALLSCLKCERRFASESGYNSHVKNHDNNAFMTCELCGKTIIAANLSSHLQTHFKQYVCEYCSLANKSKHDLEKHIKRKHTNQEFYECAFCKYKTKRICFLEKHVQHCKGPNTVPPCPHCEMQFKTQNDRLHHLRVMHRGFSCRMCAVTLENVSQYNRHLATKEHQQRSLAKKLQRKWKKDIEPIEIIE